MSKVTFVFSGIEVIIQCKKDEKMKDICQRYVNKIEKNINSLIFLYGGKQLNFNLSFNEQANRIDKERNEMKVLVYKNEDDEYICPKCGEKIKLNIKDDILSSINNIKDVINGIKINIDNIIRISKDNIINIQLKNINYLIINTLNVDIKNINEKMNNILSNNMIKSDNINTNYIIAEIDIKETDINKSIRIINSYEEWMRSNGDNELENNFKNEDQIKKCKIQINGRQLIPFNYFCKFKSKGKYSIKYSFDNNITNIGFMFSKCLKLININLSNFNSNNITNMRCTFDGCSSLTIINLINFNAKNVTDMHSMFNGCSSLTNIDLSNFNTNNVKDMSWMFYQCSSLTKINLSNFNTNNVSNIFWIFKECSKLKKENVITKDKKILNQLN